MRHIENPGIVRTVFRHFQACSPTFSHVQGHSEAVVQRCSVKKVFLEISQNSRENTCARVSFLIKLQALGLRPATLLKKRLWHRYLPVNFVKFLRIFFYRTPLVAVSEHSLGKYLFRVNSRDTRITIEWFNY